MAGLVALFRSTVIPAKAGIDCGWRLASVPDLRQSAPAFARVTVACGRASPPWQGRGWGWVALSELRRLGKPTHPRPLPSREGRQMAATRARIGA